MTDTPRTQAGRALLDSYDERRLPGQVNEELLADILAIEAEAAAAPAALPRWWDSVVRRAIYSGNNDDLTVRQLRQKLAAENPHGR